MKRAIWITGILFLSACATSYQPYSYLGGGGYEDVQLSENSFKVTFSANGYTSSTQAADMALMRAAELSLGKGFKHFVVVSSQNNDSGMAYTTPTTTTANVTQMGKTAYGTAQTYGGQTFYVAFPTPSITILCFEEKPKINGMVYDSVIVLRSMRAKYLSD